MSNFWKQIRGVAVAASVLGLALTAAAADTKGSQAAPSASPQVAERVAPVAVIVRDARTGQVRPATAQEVRALAGEVDRMFDRGASAEKAVRMPSGATAHMVSGNFANGAVVRRNADGKLELGCFDEAAPAKRFLGLEADPLVPATMKAQEK